MVGTSIVGWLWGSFSVDNPTLNRFYSFHYLFPFILAALSLAHLAALHQYGSTNPLGITSQTDLVDFYPYYYVKDLVATLVLAAVAAWLVSFYPEALGHPDNNIPANPYSTPAHIVPEWYFCVPKPSLFRWHELLNITVFTIVLGVYLHEQVHKVSPIVCCKTLLPRGIGNIAFRSGEESGISQEGSGKKCTQVTFSMAKIMNLNHSHTIIPWILALLLVRGLVGDESLPESVKTLNTVHLCDISQILAQNSWSEVVFCSKSIILLRGPSLMALAPSKMAQRAGRAAEAALRPEAFGPLLVARGFTRGPLALDPRQIQMIRLQGSNLNIGETKGTLALPKERKHYGKRAFILENKKLLQEKQETQTKNTIDIIPSGRSQSGMVRLLELHQYASATNLGPGGQKPPALGPQYNHKLENLIDYIADPDTLKLAYELVKPKTVYKKPLVFTVALEKNNQNQINMLQMGKELLAGQFQFSAVRGPSLMDLRTSQKKKRVAKTETKDKVTLETISLRDKVVLKAVELVLSSVYESEPFFFKFVNRGPSLRGNLGLPKTFQSFDLNQTPDQGVRNLLKKVKYGFQGAQWFIKADLSECCDCLDGFTWRRDSELWIHIFSKRIACEKTLALLRSALKANFMPGCLIKGSSSFTETLKGKRTGLSPLMYNICLQPLDLFMEAFCNSLNNGFDPSPPKVAMAQRQSLMDHQRRPAADHPRAKGLHQNLPKTTNLSPITEHQTKIYKNRLPLKDLPEKAERDSLGFHNVRVGYVRYSHECLVSVHGSRSLAMKVKDKLLEFMETELHLPLEKSKTFNIQPSHKAVIFLGAEICSSVQKPTNLSDHDIMNRMGLSQHKMKNKTLGHPRWPTGNGRLLASNQKWPNRMDKNKQKESFIRTGRIKLLAPTTQILNHLVTLGFLKWNSNGTVLIPTALTRLQNLTHSDILGYYNRIIVDFLEYYSFAENRHSLASTVRLLHKSCARTLTLKHKLRFMSKAFKKFGRLMECPTSKAQLVTVPWAKKGSAKTKRPSN